MADEHDRLQDGPLDRAIAILTFVAEQKKALSAAEIAASLGLPLPTAHRLIGNLESRGLIQKALGTKRYVVGSKLVTLSAKTIGAAFRTVRPAKHEDCLRAGNHRERQLEARDGKQPGVLPLRSGASGADDVVRGGVHQFHRRRHG